MSIKYETARYVGMAAEMAKSQKVIIAEIDQQYDNVTKTDLWILGRRFPAIELPWKDNQRNISRIPRGVYVWQKITRSSNGQPAIWLRDVPGRSEILIHQGRTVDHTQGCIVLPNYNELHHLCEKRGVIILL